MERIAFAALCLVTLPPAVGGEADDGFCCWRFTDDADACGTCLPAAKALPGSYCATSKETCLSPSCGVGTRWCSSGQLPMEDSQSAGTFTTRPPAPGLLTSSTPAPATSALHAARGGRVQSLVLPAGSDVPRKGTTWEMEVDGKKVSVEVLSSQELGDDGAAEDELLPVSADVSATSGTPVARHGALRTKGNKIVNEAGEPVRLRGVSMFWSQWMPQFWNADVVKWLSDDWHATVVRAAMGVEQQGYLEDPDTEMKKLDAVVQGCIDAGIYVIVDWHDYHARSHVEEAKEFFGQVAKKWGSYPNVLFEPYNEPQQSSWDDDIIPYFEEVIPEIRKHSDNLVICGTRSWDEQVSLAASSPVPGTNLAYTIHFYAASMGALLRGELEKALAKGAPVFATEWGTCEYTGDGNLNLTETQAWLDFLEENYISDVNWAISDKEESCSALQPGASASGGWAEEELTTSGKYVRMSIRASDGAGPEPTVPGGPASRFGDSGEKPLLFKK